MYARLKKDSKWSILTLGEFKINSIKEELSEYSSEWDIYTKRQESFYTHKDTKMFPIILTDELGWKPGSEVEIKKYNDFNKEDSNIEINNIFKKLEEFYSGKVIRCEVVSLKPHTNIRMHIDGGPLLHYSRRVHIPVITSEEVTFTVMDTTINMKESVWYEINNQMKHGANNPTDNERVHLIIDILPNDMINYI